MTRAEIQAQIKLNLETIKSLDAANLEWAKKALLLSDDQQWFKEEVEHHAPLKYQRKPHRLDGKLVGRIHWIEVYKDEGSGELITFERSRVVRIDGEWI